MSFRIIFLLAIVLFTGCQTENPNGRISEQFDIQGHRGCRGLMPENSVPGFIKAVNIGVTTIELDVVITKDKRVIVSHEPFISHSICLDTTGRKIPVAQERNHNIYEMNYFRVIKYNCGSMGHPDFPSQEKMDVRKPLLSSVIMAVESFTENQGLSPVSYNIETKIQEIGDNVYHPEPEEFTMLLLKEMEKGNIADRSIVQSFDPRTLNILHDLDPDIKTSLLVTNQLAYKHNLQRLDFKPTIFSPNKIFITQNMIDFMHSEGIQVIPWTVNKKEKMEELILMGVDGIITDYPNRLVEVAREMGVAG